MSSDSALPSVQQAWMVVNQGKPRDAMVLKTDIPVPKPKKNEVLVKVHAAALNPVGWKVMAFAPNILVKRPYPPEHDFAGVVVDANDTPFSNGDHVVGLIPFAVQFKARQGALAQYVTIPKDYVTPKPSKLTWEEAAALPLAALTAVQSLRLGGYEPMRALDPASLPAEPGSVFINGGSTAVGIYAIQLAKALSLHVTTTASARNASFVRDLGADAFLDYTAQPITKQLLEAPPEEKFGMILDAVGLPGTDLYVKSGAYVKKGGAYVTTGPFPGETGWLRTIGNWMYALLRPAFWGGTATSFKIIFMEHKQEDMQMLCTLIERGALRPYVDSTYEFGSALDAYDKIMSGRATGKVIVKIE